MNPLTSKLCISADHPALPGHFPGQPVVPAVVILDRVIAEIRRSQPRLTIIGIRKMKFLRRLEPDAEFELECGEARGESLRFRCRRNGEVLVEGNLLLASQAPCLEHTALPVA